MTLGLENFKDTINKLLKLINKFSKIVRYKINIQKSVAFLYTNNKLSKKGILKIPFKIASKRGKYLRINLTKEMKNPYIEIYKKDIDERNGRKDK